jgi:hypothetical protein
MEVRVSWPNGEIERLTNRAKTFVLKQSHCIDHIALIPGTFSWAGIFLGSNNCDYSNSTLGPLGFASIMMGFTNERLDL